MNGYDWNYGFGLGRSRAFRRRYGGYDRDFPRARAWYGDEYRRPRQEVWGRGEYGDAYPRFGGYPGSLQRGTFYGGGREYQRRPGGYPTGYRGYDLGYPAGYRSGYEPGGRGGAGNRGDFAREPFMPEVAYQRHPEYDRPQREPMDRWPARGHEVAGPHGGWSDNEVRQSVKENMYQDRWIDPNLIEVQVDDGVVTLRGEVGDYLQARYAWDDAWEAAGVRGVINQLTVRTDRPAQPHGDVLPQTGGE